MNHIIFEGAVRDYTTWLTYSAFIWIMFGIWLAYASVRAAKRHEPRQEIWSGGFPMRPVYYALFGIGLIFIACNVPTLLKPRAWAIHKVLQDSQHHYPAGITITNTP